MREATTVIVIYLLIVALVAYAGWSTVHDFRVCRGQGYSLFHCLPSGNK